MHVSELLELLGYGNQLKRTPRTGWSQRGIAQAESVAAHSYGVAYTVLMLARIVDEVVLLDRALAMAVLHDLPEALTTDIPTPAWQYLPAGVKTAVERKAMEKIMGQSAQAVETLALWEELRANETAEARLVHDADGLDMFLQAFVYEQQTGNRQLAEFWSKPRSFHFAEAQALYDELRSLRKQE